MAWIHQTVALTALGIAAVTLAACNPDPKDVTHLSEERRIWVVRKQEKHDTTVYRCADGAGPDQPPKPVCIRAPFTDQ